MKRIFDSGHTRGFALPTVMIASVVMLMVLLSGLVSASSVNASLRAQYNKKLLQLASEAGTAMVNACMAQSYNIPGWTDAKPLKPNTNCNGDVVSGASQYVLDTPTLKTTFEVPGIIIDNATQRATVRGKLLAYRASGTGTPKETAEDRGVLVSSQNSFSNVAFGYSWNNTADNGAQFAVVLATGEVKAVGANNNGRLGNGTTTNTVTPTNFILPAGERGAAAFTNFLSVGYNMFVLTQSGKVYGAGYNVSGQLGNGSSTTSPVSTPVQFGSFGNSGQPKAKFVSLIQDATYVLADDNNIYSAGSNNYGMLGRTCSGACTTPGRVGLPTPNTADLNTLPVVNPGWVQPTNIAADRNTMYVRMQGGAVYGWGINDWGQLGNGTQTNATTPVRIGSFGNAGVPKAVQIGQDGITIYILDDQGDVWVAGYNAHGGFGGAATQMNLPNGYCMDVPGANYSNTVQLTIYSCNRFAQQKYQWYPDGTIRVGGKCIDNRGNVNANGNPIQLYDCNNGVAQQWVMTSTGGIQNPATGRCIDNSGNLAQNANPLVLYDCNNGAAQQWSLAGGSLTLEKIPKPVDAGRFIRLTTDQFNVILLDENGKAWGAGINDFGQLGNGGVATVSPSLKAVTGIPAGGKIIDIYTTKYGNVSSGGANSYFILDDGSVYGAGLNQSGQLGDGTTTNSSVPKKMNLPAGVQAKTVQTGYGTTVVLTTTGKIYTVGNNSNGQLGDGTTTNSSVPKANQYTNQRSTISY